MKQNYLCGSSQCCIKNFQMIIVNSIDRNKALHLMETFHCQHIRSLSDNKENGDHQPFIHLRHTNLTSVNLWWLAIKCHWSFMLCRGNMFLWLTQMQPTERYAQGHFFWLQKFETLVCTFYNILPSLWVRHSWYLQ